MRQGEILALRWHDINLDTRGLQVRHSLRLQGGAFVFSEPKTKYGKRKIILNPEMVDLLRAHRKRQLSERLVAGAAWNDQNLVFCNEVGQPLDGISLYRWAFKRILRNADLPDIRFHDLRHTAATLLPLTNLSPKVVSEMLGHASIGITLDTYSHVQPSMQEDAAAAMRSMLWGIPSQAEPASGERAGGRTE
jgi:integrase